MVPHMENPRVTEIHVRMDCNGCVQKIKKALTGINGIYDIHIDIPQQKLTVTGWVDPEKIVKAIKKTRKAATICSDTEPAPPLEPSSEGGEPPPEPENPPPEEPVPLPEPAEPAEPPKEPPPPPENPPPPPPEPSSTNSTVCQPGFIPEEVHVVHHYPPDQSNIHVYNGHLDGYTSAPKREPPPPIHVNHSYNTYKPTPYVTEYKYNRPPPQHKPYVRPEPPPQYTHYSGPEPPQQYTHYSRPEPPRPYTHYSRPKPPEAPLQYTNYNRREPPQLYENYSRPELPPQYTNYGGQEPPPLSPQYTHYSGEYHSSTSGSGNITSIFSDENPNACTIA